MRKITSVKKLLKIRQKAKKQRKKIVFTNGCFDLLHVGHIKLLKKAKSLGDILIVGLNSDSSIKKLNREPSRRDKDDKRPILPQKDRAEILSSLESVDYVCLFNEQTPLKLIRSILPDVLVKGADYKMTQIVGREEVLENGGKVVTVPLYRGKSTTQLIRSIVKRYTTC
ncbi:MAG: Bifunctional sugar kinase/adenylyltransferase [candidate division Zixibacteria bacterium RBG-1]|nr:MAG: Bifunctional sugar kinase/adenylyltransferase [candidate division Zixibacteria bacterium RBG-1]OGC85791.1 MAG: hypothetical protein A2V73_08365 [candidate division Zixibacteria bacterium RBG_19FT_COMBO_42_43]